MFLDRHLVTRSFTPVITGIFNLMEIDRRRPLTDIVSEIVELDLASEVKAVLASGRSREHRVTRRGSKAHYLRRALPYHTGDDTPDGVTVILTDITRVTEIEEQHRGVQLRLDTLLHLVLGMATESLPESAASALSNRLDTSKNLAVLAG